VYPDTAVWASRLLSPLDHTAHWLRTNAQQRLTLSGSYRLSAAFALGWSFRSAIGFELDIETRSGLWSTDDRPSAGTISPPWTIVPAQRTHSGRLVATIGVLRDPSADVALSNGLDRARDVFVASLAEPIPTAAAAQASVGVVKVAIARNAAGLAAQSIDLYIAGPAALAVAIAHRWNALPPTQLHEFVTAERRYVPTVRIG
jgi:SMODS-associated and fused to various effectors sensor domain